MAFDISKISLNVSLGDTQKVTKEMDSLIKTLESKKIKLEVDTTGISKKLKEVESLYTKLQQTQKTSNQGNSNKTGKEFKDASNQIQKAQNALEKFISTKNNKLNNMMVGTDSGMIFNLSEYEKVVSKMNELKNLKLDGSNISSYTEKIKETQQAFDALNTRVKEVKTTSTEMNSSAKISDDIINKVRVYNTQLELMRQKNSSIASNPLYQQIANDVNKLSQANQPLKQLTMETGNIDSNMRRLKASMTSVTSTTGAFTRLGNSIKSAFSFMSTSMIFYQLANQIRQMPGDIVSLDTALVDLKKTTSMTTSELENFY